MLCLTYLSYIQAQDKRSQIQSEKLVRQRLPAVYAPVGVYFQAPAHQVRQQPLPRQNLLGSFKPNHIFDAFDPVLVDEPVPEELAQGIVASFVHHPVGEPARVLLDHGQVLLVGVRGEEQLPRDQLADDAPDRPHVADLVPLAALQDDLGRPVLASVDDGAVVFVVVGGAPEVDHPHLFLAGQVELVPVRVLLVAGLVVVGAFQQYVLRLQVRMRVPDFVQEPD